MCPVRYYRPIDKWGSIGTFEWGHDRWYGNTDHERIVHLGVVWRLKCRCSICFVSVVSVCWNSVYIGGCYTHVAVTDACETGLGILLSNGMAARWEISKHLQQRAHINLLKFLGQLAAIWTLAIENCITLKSCLLVNGDSSTAQGWIRKSNFSSEDESDPEINVKLQVAKKCLQFS